MSEEPPHVYLAEQVKGADENSSENETPKGEGRRKGGGAAYLQHLRRKK